MRLLNAPSLALLMGTLFAFTLHLLRGYPALLLSALAIIAITLSGKEHKLIWGAIGGAVMASGWVNTLSPTAGLIGAVVGYTLLALVSAFLLLLKLSIITLFSKSPSNFSWLVTSMSLAGLEKLYEEVALFKYPILSEAFLLVGTKMAYIGAYGYHVTAIWFYYTLLLPFLYGAERLIAYSDFLQLKELILRKTSSKLRDLLEVLIRGESLKLSSIAWLLRGVVVVVMALVLLPNYHLRMSTGVDIKVKGISFYRSSELMRDERALEAHLMRLYAPGKVILMPEMSYIGPIEVSTTSGTLKVDLTNSSVAIVGGVFQVSQVSDKPLSGAVILRVSGKGLEPLGLQVKRALVPFGEYIPSSLERLAELLGVREVGDYTAGEDTLKLNLVNRDKELSTQVLICSESFFPQLIIGKPDLVIVLSNRMWYRGSSIAVLHSKSVELLAVWKNLTIISVTRLNLREVQLRALIP